jgi:hypothetical protein
MTIIRKMLQANDDPQFQANQFEREEQRNRTEREHQAECTRWLTANGIHKPGMTRKEKTLANLAYIKRLQATAKKSQLEPHAWAFEILTKLADGEVVHQLQEQMAREVTGVWREEKAVA